MFKGDPEVQVYNGVTHQDLDDTLRSIEVARDAYHGRAQLGYDLARDCWGKGLAQEAIRAILRFGLESMALRRMEIWTSAANAGSLRLAERLGFSRDGTLRNRILEDDGTFSDCAVFGLLREEWQR